MKKLLILFLIIYSGTLHSDIYSYKDSSGKLVFTDKKPLSDKKFTEIQLKTPKTQLNRPKAFIQKANGKYKLMLKNPYFAPIEVEINARKNTSPILRKTIEPNKTELLIEGGEEVKTYRYRWVIGNPTRTRHNHIYNFPTTSEREYRISQSFRGKYSHFKQPSIYAVDIAMPVGTYIHAARAGTVIWVKEDYHMGGSKAYFLDKANYVKILHKDGTYAVYAHILQGSSQVKPGDTVKTGDILARSGSSGFSTGPHLHFVIQRNEGLKTRSLAFKFRNENNEIFTPQAGMTVGG